MTGGTSSTVFQRVSRRARLLSGPLRPLPRWLQVLAGLVAVALGALLVTRPLDSLTVLGIYIGISCLASGVGDLAARTPRSGLRPVVTAVVWLVAGVVVLAWVGRRVDLLGPFVAGLLIVSGAVRLLDLRLGVTAERVVSALFGLSEVAFGVAALLWPDATLLVVAILFGMRCVVFGVSLLWRGLRDRPAKSRRGYGRGRREADGDPLGRRGPRRRRRGRHPRAQPRLPPGDAGRRPVLRRAGDRAGDPRSAAPQRAVHRQPAGRDDGVPDALHDHLGRRRARAGQRGRRRAQRGDRAGTPGRLGARHQRDRPGLRAEPRAERRARAGRHPPRLARPQRLGRRRDRLHRRGHGRPLPVPHRSG